MQSMTKKNQKLAVFAMFLAFGLILQAIEAMYLPSIPIPGIKLGLANLLTLMMLFYFTYAEILAYTLIRLLLASIILGNFLAPAFYFSLGGALLSLLAIILAYKALYPKVSLIGLSLIGAVFHNIGQLTVAFWLVKTSAVYMQLPILLAASVPMGLAIGLAANYSIQRLSKLYGLTVDS